MRICYVSSNLGVHDCRFLTELVQREYETILVVYERMTIPEKIASIDGLEIIHRRPNLIA